MIISKEKAKGFNIYHSRICSWHLMNPDQEAIMNSCKICSIIRDPCGCDEDSTCELCNPEIGEGKNRIQEDMKP